MDLYGAGPGLVGLAFRDIVAAMPHFDAAAMTALAAALSAGQAVPDDDLAKACRDITARLAARHPGATIEVRVPPYAAVQVGTTVRVGTTAGGPAHRRGTPPNVVEMAPATIVKLAVGSLAWDDAVAGGLVQHSGAHAGDVAAMWPLD